MSAPSKFGTSDSMSAKAKILIVEDSAALAYTYQEYLRHESCEAVVAETGKAAFESMDAAVPSVILLDLGLPDMDGFDILKAVRDRGLSSIVVVLTGQGSLTVAVDAMRLGAYDFLVKPVAADRLRVTVRNALEKQRLDGLVVSFKEDLGVSRYQGFIGSSLAMQAVYRIIDAAAASRASVFITGESGTGKEVCAEAIHRQGPRRSRPFVALNCAAIPKDLIESEIFGHTKGAFTGATADREGAAARAQGGTLFLDEICEMDINLQSKLLRFVQTGTFQKVGGARSEQADLRFIAATNRDPLAEVAAGRFREDLYYRLHVIPVTLPPLRERDTDVIELADFFLKKFSAEEGKKFRRFSKDAKEALLAYGWPGNVRQLENVIRNVVVLNDGDEVEAALLPPPLGQSAIPMAPMPSVPAASPTVAEPGPAVSAPAAPQTGPDVLRPLWIQEKEIIEKAITICGENIPRAALYLEISPSTIYRKKQSWEQGGS